MVGNFQLNQTNVNSNLKIIVCCHKVDPNIRKDNIYKPLHVGKALSNKDFGFQGDDSGDNISHKNKNYCELTGLYWAWKNLNCEYIGLAHYRRYFKLDFSKIEHYMSKYDIIIPTLNILNMSAADKLMHLTTRDDFYIMLMSLVRLYPGYKPTIIKQLFNRNRCSCYNMFICRKSLCDKYCEWLFSIFSDMERYVRLSRYSRLARLYGFLSEYLLLVYCKHNNLKIKYVDVDFCNDIRNNHTLFERFPQLKRVINIIRYDISFRLSYIPQKKIPIVPTTTNGFVTDNIPYIDENGEINTELST